MTNQPPFSAVLLLGIAIIVSITAWLFSYWDRQEEKLFAKQEAAQRNAKKLVELSQIWDAGPCADRVDSGTFYSATGESLCERVNYG